MVEFPYQNLREVNQRRSQQEREYELEDTGAFDNDRYWEVSVVSYATLSTALRHCTALHCTFHFTALT